LWCPRTRAHYERCPSIASATGCPSRTRPDTAKGLRIRTPLGRSCLAVTGNLVRSRVVLSLGSSPCNIRLDADDLYGNSVVRLPTRLGCVADAADFDCEIPGRDVSRPPATPGLAFVAGPPQNPSGWIYLDRSFHLQRLREFGLPCRLRHYAPGGKQAKVCVASRGGLPRVCAEAPKIS
jgi:hypothetical protein